jgi:hypothetical protein
MGCLKVHPSPFYLGGRWGKPNFLYLTLGPEDAALQGDSGFGEPANERFLLEGTVGKVQEGENRLPFSTQR